MNKHFKIKNQVLTTLFSVLLLSCGEAPKKTGNQKEESEIVVKEEVPSKTLPSGDYSTLLLDYQCGMDAAETAKAIGVSENSIGLSDYQKRNFCSFKLKGFGKNKLGDPTTVTWEMMPSSKAQNKSEIEGALKNQEKYPEQVMQGMGIVLAETGDAYIFKQPHVGRVLIYNENYDNAFMISYGNINPGTDRTKEKHQELTNKMVALANYLLKKHRK